MEFMGIVEFSDSGVILLSNGQSISVLPTDLFVTRICVMIDKGTSFLRVYRGENYEDCWVRAADYQFMTYEATTGEFVESFVLDTADDDWASHVVECTIDDNHVFLETKNGEVVVQPDKRVFFRHCGKNLFRINIDSTGSLVFFPEYVDKSVLYMYTQNVALIAPDDIRVHHHLFEERLSGMLSELALYTQLESQLRAGRRPDLGNVLSTRIDEYRAICDEALTYDLDCSQNLREFVKYHDYIQRQIERFAQIDKICAEIMHDVV